MEIVLPIPDHCLLMYFTFLISYGLSRNSENGVQLMSALEGR